MGIRFGEDTIEIPPPLISIFGRGFHFDRIRRAVTMRQRFLWWRVSEEEIPFSDISDVRLGIHLGASGIGYGTDPTIYSIDMIIASRGTQPATKFELLRIGDRPKAMRILVDMRRFVGKDSGSAEQHFQRGWELGDRGRGPEAKADSEELLHPTARCVRCDRPLTAPEAVCPVCEAELG